MERIITRPSQKPRKRVRDPRLMARYHEIRAGLLCEWCNHIPGSELNHILHGSKKEDAYWNYQVLCHWCHQDPRIGFHGSEPLFTVADALRQKLREGFVLPREAYAYLEGVDTWPGVDPDPVAAEALAVHLADVQRRR